MAPIFQRAVLSSTSHQYSPSTNLIKASCGPASWMDSRILDRKGQIFLASTFLRYSFQVGARLYYSAGDCPWHSQDLLLTPWWRNKEVVETKLTTLLAYWKNSGRSLTWIIVLKYDAWNLDLEKVWVTAGSVAYLFSSESCPATHHSQKPGYSNHCVHDRSRNTVVCSR